MTDNNRRNEKNESEIHKESINTSNTTESQLEDKWMVINFYLKNPKQEPLKPLKNLVIPYYPVIKL